MTTAISQDWCVRRIERPPRIDCHQRCATAARPSMTPSDHSGMAVDFGKATQMGLAREAVLNPGDVVNVVVGGAVGAALALHRVVAAIAGPQRVDVAAAFEQVTAI